MSAYHLKTLQQVFEKLKTEKLKVAEKDKLITKACDLYRNCQNEIISTKNQENQQDYGLLNLSEDIFEMALQEIDENDKKYLKDSAKENKVSRGFKTNAYYLAIDHIKNCAKNIDNNTVPWVSFLLNALKNRFIRRKTEHEVELSGCLHSCASNSQLHWIEHDLMKKLWNHIWKRVAHKPIDSVLLSNYMKIAIVLMENVEICVLEETPVALVKTIVNALKESAEKLEDREFWTHSRKYSYALIYSFVVKNWGLEARDFLIMEIFDFVSFFSTMISLDNTQLNSSKTLAIHLLDDFLKLAMIDGVKGTRVRTLPEELRTQLRELANEGVVEALKSAYSPFLNRLAFQIEPEFIECIARWILTEQHLSNRELIGNPKYFNTKWFDFNGLACLKYGEDILVVSMRCNAWNAAVRIIDEVVKSGRIENETIEWILTTYWKKRKSFATDVLRSSFCAFLTSVIKSKKCLKYGKGECPSIDSILKYALSLMPNLSSLPSSSTLLETILRRRNTMEISTASLELICDTVSRTNQTSAHVLRVISAILAYSEFDENSHFCRVLDDEKRSWTLRKDIIDWLLSSNVCVQMAPLLQELCQYHPIFCYSRVDEQKDDPLLEKIKKCNLLKMDSKIDAENDVNFENPIQNMTSYVDEALKKQLDAEITIEGVLLAWEFSADRKSIDLREYLPKFEALLNNGDLEQSQFNGIIEKIRKWPEFLRIPKRFLNGETVLRYVEGNLESSELLKFEIEENLREEVLERVAERVRNDEELGRRCRRSVVFNEFVKMVIMQNINDIYETAKRFGKYAMFLSNRQLMAVRAMIVKTSSDYLKTGNSIDESDDHLIEDMTATTCLKNVRDEQKIACELLNPFFVGCHPENVYFDDRNLLIFLRKLKSSPFLAQNLVRRVIGDEKCGHLRVMVLQYLIRNRGLLMVCLATIANLKRFFEIHQVCLKFDQEIGEILSLNLKSVKKCANYLKNAKKFGNELDVEDLTVLLGAEERKWCRMSFRFWKLYEKEPHLVCEKLDEFAEKCVKLGLLKYVLKLMKIIGNSEFSRRKKQEEANLFRFLYRSIFYKVVEREGSDEIVEICWDKELKLDVVKNLVKSRGLRQKYHAEIVKFETEMAFEVENFLQNGFDGRKRNDRVFGYLEFFKQLNENLAEEVVKSCQERGFYILDFLVICWNQLVDMRQTILPIVARFSSISKSWQRFPQPLHVVTDENNIENRLKLNFALRIMGKRSSSKKLELSSIVMLYLACFDGKYVAEKHLSKITEIYGNPTNSPIFITFSQLRKEIKGYEEIVEKRLMETMLVMGACFPEIGAIIMPFLFLVAATLAQRFQQTVAVFLGCLAKIDQENSRMVMCLAECMDSIGLAILAICEPLDSDTNPSYSTKYFFDIARCFVKHNFLSHAFALANLLFDRLCRPVRNMMIIDKIPMSNIENSEEIIELLMQIYIGEENSIALGSLPTGVQTRPEVRKVMYLAGMDWKKLVSSSNVLLDEKEMVLAKWMCGLQPDRKSSEHNYLDSILRCKFVDYPKILNSTSKFVYFVLFHLAIDTSQNDLSRNFFKILAKIYKNLEKLSINDVRMIMLASGMAGFEPISVVEHVICVVRMIRETARNRAKKLRDDVNSKTGDVLKVARMLAKNQAFEAAQLLLQKWRKECAIWLKNGFEIDMDLIEVCQHEITCKSGDVRMAETRLRQMFPRMDSMTPTACAEFTTVFSKIVLEHENDMENGIQLLKKGCRKLVTSEQIEAKLNVLLMFHSICLEKLSKLEEYRETRSYRMKVKAISAFEEQIMTVSRRSGRMTQGTTTQDDVRTVKRVKMEQQCEKDDVEKFEINLEQAACNAVQSGLQALDTIRQVDDEQEAIRKSSLIIFPLIDMIYKYEANIKLVFILKNYASKQVDSKLWLCATSHIVSKCFSIEGSSLQKTLCLILTRLVLDYPYHVLHTLLMYEYESNGAEVRRFIDALPEKSENRAKLREIIKDMREAHNAYRQLAKLDVKVSRECKKVVVNGKSAYELGDTLKIFRCNLAKLPIPTISQRIGAPGDYEGEGLIKWSGWKRTVSIADGLSAPKIWEIQGSDERWYRTVWKKDDVRQDVLVEQMFDVTNNMLETKPCLRTYNVVPIDTECGIIEFCGGTISIKELLCGANRDSGLHRQMCPKEPSVSAVSSRMRECQRESAEVRRKVFVDICRGYSPVFRHFFYSNFPTAHIWREKIEEYRRSLAAWSVVCYIVGLGDRHSSNILFDQKMCNFVHIDLGMILEYSKRSLPVPEQVPFRMSRDILDPILIEGVENGQLAHICTETIEKLKENGKVILGVASALLRETMSNFRETELAAGRPSYISEMAIGRLRDKLEGTDAGVTAEPSSLQIRRLLREATSADNLSRMFCGWMPFM